MGTCLGSALVINVFVIERTNSKTFCLLSQVSIGRRHSRCGSGPWVAAPERVRVISHQLIAGPLLMAVTATQGANCTSGAILGFTILLKDTSTCSSVPPGFKPAIFRSLVHQLYPLSYSCPSVSSTYTVLKENKEKKKKTVYVCCHLLLCWPYFLIKSHLSAALLLRACSFLNILYMQVSSSIAVSKK